MDRLIQLRWDEVVCNFSFELASQMNFLIQVFPREREQIPLGNDLPGSHKSVYMVTVSLHTDPAIRDALVLGARQYLANIPFRPSPPRCFLPT